MTTRTERHLWRRHRVLFYKTEDGGKIRIGVAAVGLDYDVESDIAWGDWFEPMSIDPVIVEGTEIDKPIIKAGEEFTLKYTSCPHFAWQCITKNDPVR